MIIGIKHCFAVREKFQDQYKRCIVIIIGSNFRVTTRGNCNSLNKQSKPRRLYMVNSIHPQPATINQGNGEAHPSLAAGGNSQKVNSSAFEIFKGIALTTAISGTTAFTAYGIKRIYSQGLPEGIGNKIWLGAVCFV